MLPFRLMLITDWSIGREALLERVRNVLSAGPGIAVQHRHPGVSTRQFLDEGRALANLCEHLFINSRLDVALALKAHLHLGTHALSIDDVRPHLPRGALVSHAVHSLAEYQPGADLALVSPVFAPSSKPDDTRSPLGPHGFQSLARQLPCPAFALGGLTVKNAAQVMPAVGVAAIQGLSTAHEASELLRLTAPIS